jgi:anti-sigma factor RsiW
MSTCTWVRTSLGVYVLGAIEPAERAEVDSHLPACSRCRDEVAALAGLPALLGRVNEEQIAEITGPPEELLESLLATAVAERPRRRRRPTWLPLMAAAAVVLVVGALLGGLLTRGSSDDARPPVALPTVTVTPTVPEDPHAATEHRRAVNRAMHVNAVIGMRGEEWGTAVTVRLSGAPQGTRCRLYAVAKDGRRDVAASWWVAYAGSEDFFGSTMISRADLAKFEVLTMDGRRLLTVPV